MSPDASGSPIRGTAVFTNRSGAPITVEACAADDWLDVALSNHTVAYDPAHPLVACAPTVRLATGVTRIPITVGTAYEGCTQSTPGTAGYPPCAPGGSPPLPAGTCHTTVVTTGLPAGRHVRAGRPEATLPHDAGMRH